MKKNRFGNIESKSIIEKKLGKKCDYFAYPNGDYTSFSDSCVKEANYKLGFSTKKDNILNSQLKDQSLPRISVPYNFDTFKIIISL